MKTHPYHRPEDLMDADLFSHIMLWIVGAITAVGAVGLIGALWSMGRQGYSRD